MPSFREGRAGESDVSTVLTDRWREFHKRYFEELRANHAVVEYLTDLISAGKVTLLFGAHDTERNNAVALADSLAAH